jgi:hypothetical protein
MRALSWSQGDIFILVFPAAQADSSPGLPVIIFIVRPTRPAAQKCRNGEYDKDRHRDDNAQGKTPYLGQYDSDKSRRHHAKGEQSDPVHAGVDTKPVPELQ